MTQKEKISYLIKTYADNLYTTEDFCDIFVCTLYYETDNTIPPNLYSILESYATKFSRYSSFDDEVKTGILFGEDVIKQEFKQLQHIWMQLGT